VLSNIEFAVASGSFRLISAGEVVVMLEREWRLVGNAGAVMAKRNSIVVRTEKRILISSIVNGNQDGFKIKLLS
jgi:hypothetical protein